MEFYIAFSSITHAMRIEKLAKKSGMRCSVVRTPSILNVGGCGYSLKTKTEETAKAILGITEQAGIANLGFFCLKGDEAERLS